MCPSRIQGLVALDAHCDGFSTGEVRLKVHSISRVQHDHGHTAHKTTLGHPTGQKLVHDPLAIEWYICGPHKKIKCRPIDQHDSSVAIYL